MRLRSIAAASAAAILLSGCATGGVPTPSATIDPAADTTGSITVWSWDVAAVALERLAVAYEKEHPGTQIEVVDTGYDNAYDRISVGLQAGSGLPDLITLETDRAAGYLSQFPEGFADLTPVIGDLESEFDPSKWSAAVAEDGSVRLIPWDSGTVALYYRADYLEQAGVDITQIDTWQQLADAGERVLAETGHTLMSIDLESGATFLMMLQQQGLGIFDEQGDIAIASPEAVETLALLQRMADAGLIDNVTGWDGRVTAAAEGASAVHPEAVWWMGTLRDEMPDLAGTYGVVPLPTFDGRGARTSNNGGSNLAIPAQAANPVLAADFARYVLADADSQASMMTEEGLFPSYLPALATDAFQQPDPYFRDQPVLQVFSELTAEIPPITYTSDTATATSIVGSAVVAAVLNGQEPQAALEEAAAQIASTTGRAVSGS
jgi:lactose/L-arabinose transport system substrate-binding protein